MSCKVTKLNIVIIPFKNSNCPKSPRRLFNKTAVVILSKLISAIILLGTDAEPNTCIDVPVSLVTSKVITSPATQVTGKLDIVKLVPCIVLRRIVPAIAEPFLKIAASQVLPLTGCINICTDSV